MSRHRYIDIECGAAIALPIFSITSPLHLFSTYCTHVIARRHSYRVLESKMVMAVWPPRAKIELSIYLTILFLLE